MLARVARVLKTGADKRLVSRAIRKFETSKPFRNPSGLFLLYHITVVLLKSYTVSRCQLLPLSRLQSLVDRIQQARSAQSLLHTGLLLSKLGDVRGTTSCRISPVEDLIYALRYNHEEALNHDHSIRGSTADDFTHEI